MNLDSNKKQVLLDKHVVSNLFGIFQLIVIGTLYCCNNSITLPPFQILKLETYNIPRIKHKDPFRNYYELVNPKNKKNEEYRNQLEISILLKSSYLVFMNLFTSYLTYYFHVPFSLELARMVIVEIVSHAILQANEINAEKQIKIVAIKTKKE